MHVPTRVSRRIRRRRFRQTPTVLMKAAEKAKKEKLKIEAIMQLQKYNDGGLILWAAGQSAGRCGGV